MSEPQRRRHTKLNTFWGKGARTDEPIQLSVGVKRKHLSLSHTTTRFSLLHASKTFWAVLLFAGCQHARPACPAEDLCHSAPCMCSPKGVCLCDETQNTSGPARELKIQMHSHAIWVELRTSLSFSLSVGIRELLAKKVVKLAGDLFLGWLFHWKHVNTLEAENCSSCCVSVISCGETFSYFFRGEPVLAKSCTKILREKLHLSIICAFNFYHNPHEKYPRSFYIVLYLKMVKSVHQLQEICIKFWYSPFAKIQINESSGEQRRSSVVLIVEPNLLA